MTCGPRPGSTMPLSVPVTQLKIKRLLVTSIACNVCALRTFWYVIIHRKQNERVFVLYSLFLFRLASLCRLAIIISNSDGCSMEAVSQHQQNLTLKNVEKWSWALASDCHICCLFHLILHCKIPSFILVVSDSHCVLFWRDIFIKLKTMKVLRLEISFSSSSFSAFCNRIICSKDIAISRCRLFGF